jgi:glyoxylase-like metal-dependent hydrolase (beta-lactamase superfamily II)
MLEVISYVLGPVQTNAYLAGDTESREAIVVDPGWDGDLIFNEAVQRGWDIKGIWLTHAHFDHIGGVASLVKHLPSASLLALHPDDMPLWRMQGGAPMFGMQIGELPTPNYSLEHGQRMNLGEYSFEVKHAPGHTAGHVVFYCETQSLVFCGDVIFNGSIGRTDLPGGDYRTLINSIHSQILPLADNTRLLSGHGPETSVGHERVHNPFLS